MHVSFADPGNGNAFGNLKDVEERGNSEDHRNDGDKDSRGNSEEKRNDNKDLELDGNNDDEESLLGDKDLDVLDDEVNKDNEEDKKDIMMESFESEEIIDDNSDQELELIDNSGVLNIMFTRITSELGQLGLTMTVTHEDGESFDIPEDGDKWQDAPFGRYTFSLNIADGYELESFSIDITQQGKLIDSFDSPNFSITLSPATVFLDNMEIELKVIVPETFNVYYNANGGTGSQSDDNDYEEDDEVTVLGQGTMERDGFRFIEWNTKSDGTGTAYDEDDTFDMGDSDVTLYAQWGEEYEVFYDKNAEDATGSQSDPNKYLEDDEVTVLGKGTMEREGHTFDGWKDDEGTSYEPDDTFDMPAEDVTLYAQWEPVGAGGDPETYNVSYDGNENTGGAEPIDNNDYEEGDEVTVLGKGSLVKEGFKFIEWNTEADGSGDSYDQDDKFNMPADDLTLYAQWDENELEEPAEDTWTVTFLPGNRGSLDGKSVFTEIEDGSDWDDVIVEPDVDPDRNYRFTGWSANFPDKITENLTFTAKYRRVSTGGGGPTNPPVVETEEIEEPTPEAPPVVTPPVITPPAETPEAPPEVIEVPVETPAAAPTLPKTGSVGAGEMAGSGALLMAIGVLLKKKKGF